MIYYHVTKYLKYPDIGHSITLFKTQTLQMDLKKLPRSH